MATIVITATIDVDPARRAETLEKGQTPISQALAERGCVAYTWSIDPVNPGRIHVFEEWTDEEALAEHFLSAPYRDMSAVLRGAGVVKSVSAKYRVDAIAPVYNSKGVATVGFDGS